MTLLKAALILGRDIMMFVDAILGVFDMTSNLSKVGRPPL